VVQIGKGLQNCLQDLRGFSHLWLLWWGHLAKGFSMRVQPPRDAHKRGLFATRAPNRPNPIGLSCVRLLCIDKRQLHIADHDLLDGTPILDIKPYLPYCDAVPDAATGYVAGLPADAGDHRSWWQQKQVPAPLCYQQRSGREPGTGP
jgi:tRNA-Thr(GGU) m(6)t(6)A37 methyltransferase TsaA